MSWETRGGNGPYYTRSHKRGGKVRRQYIGGGNLATLWAQLDALDRQERQAELTKRREQRTEDERIDALLDELCRVAEAAAHVALIEAGFHNHKSQWRKRNGR